MARPGKYFWAANLRVSHLLLRAGGLLPNAYLQRADLLRLTGEQTYTTIPVNLKSVLERDPEADLTLLRGDILQVVTRAEAGLSDEVHIAGFVNNPGSYTRREGMRVSDLIFAAGGLQPGAGPTIELVRGHFAGAPETITLQLTGTTEDYQVQPDLVLTDDDSVAVAGRGDFRVHADLVHLQGQVNNPGSYTIKSGPGERDYTVWDLIQDGGGLLDDANAAGIVVYRTRDKDVGDAQSEDLQRVLAAVNREASQPTMQVNPNQQQAMNQTVTRGLQQVITNPGSVSIVLPPRPVKQSDWVAAIPVDGEALIASRGREGNLALTPGDTVVVPRRVHTVMVLGAVPRSGAVPFVADLRCRDYINESGGLREDAASDRLVVVHANGSVEPIRMRSEVAAGDIIVVPTRHIVRTVRTESELKLWLRNLVPLVTTALLVK
ncbi:MAG: SLBB domain-containing protein [Armatimonadetes bacterium]|nr:SLBB domain-containing protein [Armatimonadota bacterium]